MIIILFSSGGYLVTTKANFEREGGRQQQNRKKEEEEERYDETNPGTPSSQIFKQNLTERKTYVNDSGSLYINYK